ncbi:carboxypeptidase-like regulatory domain-containing protein [Paractinoplanes rishiriensis]|uniref:Carboxypeptidase regulatory-like domain-containing protein n=1 Tax=Paractinoplanes rishiriensis TaxID=1050105 RepID=A0A919K8N0_9ACTN|nr:carboxypeptidase-like regulatory domain-containing protein [Actinoplanes rishiriensis]GIF00519.1 hypothetical protein Ari01nite_79830 [Actinoplanes rishiriensis]
MRTPRPMMIALLAAVPLLLGAGWMIAAGGDTPVSDSDPPGPPAGGKSVIGTVAGVVARPDGSPVPGANVQVTSLDNPQVPVPEIGVMTGTDGRYVWSLRGGRYELKVAADSATATGTTTVKAGQSVTLNLTLG